MKRISKFQKKVIIICVLTLILISLFYLSFCCIFSEKQVVGTWISNYQYHNSTVDSILNLNEDGTFENIRLRDGENWDKDVGTWSIHNNKVITQISNNDFYEVDNKSYSLFFGMLTWAGHHFQKQS